MRVVRRDPNKGYLDTLLWVPKSKVNVEGVKNALTFQFSERDKIKFLTLWRETTNHLLVPREFWDTNEGMDFPIVDCRPTTYPEVDIRSRIQLDHRNEGGKLVPTGERVQRDSIEALLRSRGGILQLACGKGKAQPLTSHVLTPTGWKEMGALQVGDTLCGTNSGTQFVTGVFDQGPLEVFEIEFDDGEKVRCCDDHLWWTSTPSERRDGTEGSVKTLREIRATLRTRAGAQHSIPYCAPPYLEDVGDLPLHPWLLGAYLGDGSSTTGTVRFDKAEEDVLEKFTTLLPEQDEVRRETRTGSKNTSLAVRRKQRNNSPSETYFHLDKLGLLKKRSYEKFIPEMYKYTSVENRLELLRGIVDTDGTVSYGHIEYTTTSPQLRDDIVFLAQSLGGRVTWSRKQTHYTKGGERISCRTAFRMRLSFPGAGLQPFSAKKHATKWQGTHRLTRRYIVSVRRVGTEACRCISVSSPSKLYITDGFAVTHNTVVALEFAARLRVPTIIVVDTTQLVRQWTEAIETLLDTPDGIGTIGDGKFDWKKPIVIATYHTLGARARDFPEEARRWFGLIIWDEAHHVGAPTFSKTADLFSGIRLGLTATPARADGYHVIYNHHIGKVIFKDLSQELKPRIFFLWTGLSLNPEDPLVVAATRDKNGELHLNKIAGFFGQWRARLELILQGVRHFVAEGRKIIVLSKSIDETVNLLALWNGRQDLYSDVPFPMPQEVGETETPFELSAHDAKKIKKDLAITRAQLKDPTLNPLKREKFQQRLEALNLRLEQGRVFKKCNSEYQKRLKQYRRELLEMPSSGGLMISKVDPDERTRLLRSKQVTFAIAKYGREGLDERSLDTIVVCEPLSDEGALQQLMGRVQRKKDGKKEPYVVFLEDDIGPMIGMCVKLRNFLRSWPAENGGPYEYELLGHPNTTFRRKTWSTPRVSGSS